MVVHPQVVKGCPNGTSDLLIVCPNGKVIWCECKTLKGCQREDQKAFQRAMEDLGHTYIIARDVDTVINTIKRLCYLK